MTGSEARPGRALGIEWYRRTGIYPFHGVIVLKDGRILSDSLRVPRRAEAYGEPEARAAVPAERGRRS